MDNCHSIGTPLATNPKLDVDLSREPVDQSDYRSKIGSLMYLTSSSRLSASTRDHARHALILRKALLGGLQLPGVISRRLDVKETNCTAWSSAGVVMMYSWSRVNLPSRAQ
ncbi:hypothetical protein Tco_0201642 [Tanacetum coccineum]